MTLSLGLSQTPTSARDPKNERTPLAHHRGNKSIHRGEAVLRKHLRTFEESQISNIIWREPRVKRH